MLGAVLAETEVVDRASRDGDGAVVMRLALLEVGTTVGLTAGDCTRGDELLGEELLLEVGPFLLNPSVSCEAHIRGRA